MYAAAMGAMTQMFGLSEVLPLPIGAHWVAAGVLSKNYCDGKILAIPSMDSDTAMVAASGYAGGFLAALIIG